jgi:acetyl esterase/lipase
MLTRRLLLGAALGARVFAQEARQEPPFRLPDGVELELDLVYARYRTRELRLDLFRPKTGRGPFPAVVYIHGGGWRGGSKAAFGRQAVHMAAKGFVGAYIEYRLSGEVTWPAAIHDAKAAVRWVRADGAKHGIDANRIGAAGGSAGGHLASLLGTTHRLRKLGGDGGHAGVSSRVQSVAAFNPASDFPDFAKSRNENANSAVTAFLGRPFSDDAEQTRRRHPRLASDPRVTY